MKKALLLLSSILILSCVKSNHPQPAPGEDENGEFSEMVKNMVPTAEYTVPVQSGYTTIVTYKGQTLAVTSTPMTILVPKTAVGTKSLDNEGLLTYYQEGTTLQGFSQLWQTVAFEDSKTGDFDYNDLVFHAKTEVSNGKLTVSVHPIALGSVNPIQLAFEWRQGTRSGEVLVAGNCRQDLFGGKEGFINTFKYDKHYADFAIVKEVSGINGDEPVYINWFIYSSAQKIYAVNNFGKGCVDSNGNPFGIVITDTGANPGSKSGAAMTKAPLQTWNEAIAQAGFGTFPEVQQSDYENLPNLKQYESWGAGANKNYYLPAGQAASAGINATGNAFYIAGTLTLTNGWGNSKASIHILDGGELILNVQQLDVFNIYVHPGGKLTTQQNALVVSGGEFMVADTLDLTGKDLTIQGNTRVWIGSRLNVESLTMKAQGTPKLYLGCCIEAVQITISNKAELYVQASLKANILKMESGNDIFIKEGGLMEIVKTYHPANASCVVTALGDGQNNSYAVLHAGEFIVDDNSGNNLNFKNRFKGNLHLSFDKITENDKEIKPEDLKLSEGVQMADGSTYLPETPCHPSFGKPAGNGDTGACWFPYPKETVHISRCYNFEQWKQGNFDFTILNENNVFDIDDSRPIEGGQKSIYQMN